MALLERGGGRLLASERKRKKKDAKKRGALRMLPRAAAHRLDPDEELEVCLVDLRS